MIEVVYDTEKKNIFNVEFENISTNWSILTAVDIFNFKNRVEYLPNGKSRDLNDFQIVKMIFLLKKRIIFIKDIMESNDFLEDKFNLKKYLDKFDSRYDANLLLKEIMIQIIK